ncbi:MAG: DNA-binding protein WhiA, partial [Clostridiales bacterium]|nr:DNA-binding protein WhiA [Clostridiales bacterium]
AGDSEAKELVFSDGRIKKRICCRKAFLRGAFLSGGAISDPEKTYHFEITARSPNVANDIKRMLASFHLNAKIILRKGSYVSYLKEGENIVDFLNIVGAHTALMELENVRILKGMRNSVNRMVNCETANLEKTVNASVRQMDNIRYLIDNNMLGKLPENLREIAELRLSYNEASLIELGQLMSPALGKSGVNHRLRKIDLIAENERRIHEKN